MYIQHKDIPINIVPCMCAVKIHCYSNDIKEHIVTAMISKNTLLQQ